MFQATLGAVLLSLVLPIHAARSQSSANDSRLAASASAQPTMPSGMGCDTIPAYHVLDFWVGGWDVVVESDVVGHNRVDKVVHGCALIENWTDTVGGEGKSLFYYQPARQDWKQVWVDVGGVKEKHIIGRYDDGSVRFQGELPRANGAFILDRTTLSPLGDGTVRQRCHSERSAESSSSRSRAGLDTDDGKRRTQNEGLKTGPDASRWVRPSPPSFVGSHWSSVIR